MRTKLRTLALAVAGLTAAGVAGAQPAPAPSAPPPAPAPTTTADPNAPPPPAPGDPNAPAPAPTTTSTAQPAPPPPAAQPAPSGAAPQDPNAPPAPPPVQPAPPQSQPLTPAAAPPAQPAQPPAEPPAEEKKSLGQEILGRAGGSLLFWSHQATTSIFGMTSAENYASGFNGAIHPSLDVYTQALTLRPIFTVYSDKVNAVRASTVVRFWAELTNSDTTTQQIQPDVNDIPLTVTDTLKIAAWGAGDAAGANAAAVARDPTLAGAAEYRLQGVVSGSLIFPSSRTSSRSGLLLGTSLSAGLRQQIKLLGAQSEWFPNVTVSFTEGWTHQFWRSKVPVYGDLGIQRQDYTGNAQVSDILRGAFNAENRLSHTFNFFTQIYGDLTLYGTYQIINDFPYSVEGTGCEVQTPTGCVSLGPSDTKMRGLSQFDMSLYYQIMPELGVDVGYNNFNTQLGENGQYRNPVFSPSSSFYADIYIFPDQLIHRLTDPKPKNQVGRR